MYVPTRTGNLVKSISITIQSVMPPTEKHITHTIILLPLYSSSHQVLRLKVLTMTVVPTQM